jgi:hypothetical protein
MDVVDLLVDLNLRKQADGSAIFFPWGRYARGYVIAADEGYERVRSFARNWAILSLLIPSLAVGTVLGRQPLLMVFAIAAIGSVLYTVGYSIHLRVVTKNLPRTMESLARMEKLSAKGWLRLTARFSALLFGRLGLWLMLVTSILAFLMGLVGVFLPGVRLNGLMFLVIGGLAGLWSMYLMRILKEERRKTVTPSRTRRDS